MRPVGLREALADAAALAEDCAYVARVEELRAATTLTSVGEACALLAGDADEDVRLAAAHLLGAEVGDHVATGRLEAVAVALAGHAEEDVLAAIACELGRLDRPDALPTLRVLVAHRDALVRAATAAALAELLASAPAGAEPLGYLAGDDDPRVRAAAELGLTGAR